MDLWTISQKIESEFKIGGMKVDKSTKDKFEGLKQASEPLVIWLRENGCPHDSVVVEWNTVKLYSEAMGIPLKIE